jgi:NAD(P)H dehydrogenase (quinone)
MKKVTILYHSGYGHTAKLASHVEKGVLMVADTKASLLTTDDFLKDNDCLNDSHGIIFGSPTYMGSVSAAFKAFMEATSKLFPSRVLQNKIAAGFTNSHSMSGDKLNSLIQMAVFASQHGMIWVGQNELDSAPTGEVGSDNHVNRIGSYLGLMAQSNNESAKVTPPMGDLKTAEIFGKRIAEICHKFNF